MAEATRPSTTGEIQQPLKIPQGSQEKGNPDQNTAQGLPEPGVSVPNQPPPHTYQQRANNEKNSGLDIIRLIIEVLTLLTLFCYTIVTYGLWSVADQANRLNAQSARLDQRAWVSLNKITGSYAVEGG